MPSCASDEIQKLLRAVECICVCSPAKAAWLLQELLAELRFVCYFAQLSSWLLLARLSLVIVISFNTTGNSGRF